MGHQQKNKSVAFLSDSINSMYAKLDAMHFILNSVISKLGKMCDDYNRPGGSEMYDNILKWQLEFNKQIKEMNEILSSISSPQLAENSTKQEGVLPLTE